MYIACLCPNLVSVHFYAIPIYTSNFLNFLFTCSYSYILLQSWLDTFNEFYAVMTDCEENLCQSGGTCQMLAGSVICTCPPNVTGVLCELREYMIVCVCVCVCIERHA